MITKSFEKLNVTELTGLSKAELAQTVNDAAFRAIEASVLHGDVSKAKTCSVRLSVTSDKKFVGKLHSYFEQFGNLRYNSKTKNFIFARRLKNEDWTPQYADEVRSYDWRRAELKNDPADLLHPHGREDRNRIEAIVDVDKELRSLLARFERAVDSGRNVVHEALIKKVREVVADYNFSTAFKEEEARYKKTLFDKSTKRTLLRANKFAKDLESKGAGNSLKK